jgi:SOS regulatory protein LexA
MKKILTKGRDTLEANNKALYDFYRRNLRMPTYSECLELFGVKSKDTAHKIVQKLSALGYVDTDETGKILPKELSFEKRTKYRAPTQLRYDLRLLGLVDAGFSAPAEEQELDRISLDEWILGPSKTDLFMLQVSGDSMKDAGICEGDMVIVRRTNTARPGDIVIAEIDGGYTVKYLRTDASGRTYLEPANSAYKNLYPEESLNITAVVVSLVRKY